MPRFKTVLFATDFSRGSQQAFRIACSLAPEGEGRVVLLHVLDPEHPEAPPYYVGQPTVHFPAAERERGHRESAWLRLREVYVPERGLAAEYHTREGRPAEEILALADEAGCDLIVIGTHGRTRLSRLRSGSVAEAVLRRARCPVLALRSPEQRSPPAGEVRAFLAPVDASEHSREAAVVAGELARRFGARLVLLHVAPPEVTVPGVIPMPVDLNECRAFLETLRSQLDGPGLETPVETHLRRGEAASEILETAEALGCDLIVMGTHGRTGLLRLLMGSVAESVLRRSSCPVLTVRPPAPASDAATELVGVAGSAPGAGQENASNL